MIDVNKVILVGHLGKDPEARVTPTGRSVAQFSVATTRKFRERTGETTPDPNTPLREETQWHQVVAWERLGENCAQYLKKGSPVYVEGMLRERSYEGTDGVKRRVFEVYADTVNFLGSPSSRRADEAVLKVVEAVSE